MSYYNGTTLTSGPVNGSGGIVPPLSGMNDVLNLIGKSLYDVDSPLQGSIDEFRIYSSPLSAASIVLNDTVGPNNYVTSPGTLNALHLSAPDNPLVVNQSSQLAFTGDFSNVNGLNLNLYGGASYTSGNNSVRPRPSGICKCSQIRFASCGLARPVKTFSLSASELAMC